MRFSIELAARFLDRQYCPDSIFYQHDKTLVAYAHEARRQACREYLRDPTDENFIRRHHSFDVYKRLAQRARRAS